MTIWVVAHGPTSMLPWVWLSAHQVPVKSKLYQLYHTVSIGVIQWKVLNSWDFGVVEFCRVPYFTTVSINCINCINGISFPNENELKMSWLHDSIWGAEGKSIIQLIQLLQLRVSHQMRPWRSREGHTRDIWFVAGLPPQRHPAFPEAK